MDTTLLKYDEENKVLYNFDFTTHPNVVAGQTITGTPTITGSPSGLTFGTPTVDGTGKIVQIAISGGTANTLYTVKCLAATNVAGTDIEICGRLSVKGC